MTGNSMVSDFVLNFIRMNLFIFARNKFYINETRFFCVSTKIAFDIAKFLFIFSYQKACKYRQKRNALLILFQKGYYLRMRRRYGSIKRFWINGYFFSELISLKKKRLCKKYNKGKNIFFLELDHKSTW